MFLNAVPTTTTICAFIFATPINHTYQDHVLILSTVHANCNLYVCSLIYGFFCSTPFFPFKAHLLDVYPEVSKSYGTSTGVWGTCSIEH